MKSNIIKRRAEAFRPLIVEGLADGLHRELLAMHVGISSACLDKYIKLLQLPKPPRKCSDARDPGRDQEILALRQQGLTLQEIGDVHGITRERARQVLSRHFPDVAIGSRLKATRICSCCKKIFTPSRTAQYACSMACKKMSTLTKRWTRDFALRLMELRSLGWGWAAVSNELMPDLTTPAFRSALQLQIPILFSSEERARYFPANKEPRFRSDNGALPSNRIT